MGKMLSGMIAVIFMAGGLTALNISAAEASCPYTGCIDTTCHADNLNNPRVGNPARVRFRVGTGGNGAARGDVLFSYERPSGLIEAQYHKRYVGPGWDRYAFSGIPRGKYIVRVRFNSRPDNSAYDNCRTSFRQTVRPRR